MASSGTYTFGVDTPVVDLFMESYERIGMLATELTANHFDIARRSLSYLFTSWANQGPNLFAVDQLTYAIASGTQTQTLPVSTVSVLQAVWRTDAATSLQSDLTLTAISRSDYFALPNKLSTSARPTQYYLERTLTPVLYLYPVPNVSTASLVLYRMRMLQDVSDRFNQTADAPNRWMDAIAAGLAARLAQKFAPALRAALDLDAATAYGIAAAEDTEYAPLVIAPAMS